MDRFQNAHYEELYNRLLDRGVALHANNKKRIRTGLILLAILPAVLIIIRRLTDSDRVVFLIIWVICMFALCIYLISIEFIDDSIRKTLEDVTERELGFDELLLDSEGVHEKIQARLQNRRQEFMQDSYYERSYEKTLERLSKQPEISAFADDRESGNDK